MRAEVEITALAADESPSLSARLAGPEAFRQAGLEYNPALTGLDFSIARRQDGRPVVRISSARPINEPFVDLLVELNWASGRFSREYTFLLDPPGLQVASPAQAVPLEALPVAAAPAAQAAAPLAPIPAPAPAPVAAPAPTAPAAAATRVDISPAAAVSITDAQREAAARAIASGQTGASQPAASAGAVVPPPAARPGSVAVARGDTLAAIAERVRPADVSVNQAMVAIYRANPQAFFGGVHQMRSGQTLTIPSAAEMRALSPGEVAAEMRSSMQAFNEYRSRLAAAAPEVGSQAAGQQASGAVGEVREATPPAAASDQLRLSSGDASGAAGAAATGSLAAEEAAEARIARENALRESQSRVDELEKNVGDLQKLLELKNRQLADLETQLAQARQLGATASGSITPVPAEDSTPFGEQPPSAETPAPASASTAEAGDAGMQGEGDAAAPSEAQTSETLAGQEADQAAPSLAEAGSETAADTGSSDASSEQLATAAAAAGAAATSAATPGEAAVPPAGAAEPAAPAATPSAPVLASEPAPSRAPSFVDELRANPYVLLGGGALVLLGGFYMWYGHRRRKANEAFEDTLGGTDAFTANSLFGSTGGQDVDTANSLFSTNISDSAVDVHSTEVDPIAEAEVYIAYGREAQAEEILKEALRKQPERHAIRLKLLEIFAGRKDVASFNELAREMYEQSGGANEEWPKVVTFGLSIDPENPLYTGRGGVSAALAGVAAGGAAVAVGAAGAADPQADAVVVEADEPAPIPASDALGDLEFSLPDIDDEMSALPGQASSEPLGGDDLDFSIDIDSRMAAADSMPFGDGAIADLDIPSLESDQGLDARDHSGAQDALGELTADSELSKALDGRIELPSLDLGDDPDFEASLARRASSDPLADLGDINVEIPSLDTLTGEQEAETTAIDLSAIGLDLTAESISGPAGGPAGDRWQEMATKLDLASAYEEIGDKEGARELLEEVVRDGDSEQQQKARSMLSNIS